MRRELVDFLLVDLEQDPRALLESLVAALGDDACLSALEYVSREEDWRFRVKGKQVVDTETGEFVFPCASPAQLDLVEGDES